MEKIETIYSYDDIEQLAKKFKILSESSRLKILRSLFQGEKSVTEIIESTGLMQANVSKQLKILQSNNFLKCRASGLLRYYSVIDPTTLKICNILCDTNH
jgi:DNA-binding transcriptional ArsR family regulator